MKSLYIETGTEKSAIALSDGDTWYTRPLPSGPALSKNLALEVHNLLKISGIRPDKVYVGKGPGSLTGVRVGRALGKALAFGWGVPYAEFCSMEAFKPEEDLSAVLLDYRSGGIYLFSETLELLSPEEVKKKIINFQHLYSPHPEKIKKRVDVVCKESVCSFARLDENGSHQVR